MLKNKRKKSLFLQVNVSGEESKHGFSVHQLEEVYNELKTCAGLDIQGLMTIPPLVDHQEKTRRYFRKLRRVADELSLKHCSMGMSSDYRVALDEGATWIRLGRMLIDDKVREI